MPRSRLLDFLALPLREGSGKAQSAALKKSIPRRVQAPPKSFDPTPGMSSWREEQKASVAAQAPPLRSRVKRRCAGKKLKSDLTAMILARRKGKLCKTQALALLFPFLDASVSLSSF